MQKRNEEGKKRMTPILPEEAGRQIRWIKEYYGRHYVRPSTTALIVKCIEMLHEEAMERGAVMTLPARKPKGALKVKGGGTYKAYLVLPEEAYAKIEELQEHFREEQGRKPSVASIIEESVGRHYRRLVAEEAGKGA